MTTGSQGHPDDLGNPKGTITNSDLEMTAELLGWLVLEGNVPLRHEHVGLSLDNSDTVS